MQHIEADLGKVPGPGYVPRVLAMFRMTLGRDHGAVTNHSHRPPLARGERFWCYVLLSAKGTARMPVIDLLTSDQCRALQMLANVPRGIAETLKRSMSLYWPGSRRAPDMAQIGEQTIEVKLVVKTAAGRKAIER